MTKGVPVSLARQIAVDRYREGIRAIVVCPDGAMTMFALTFRFVPPSRLPISPSSWRAMSL